MECIWRYLKPLRRGPASRQPEPGDGPPKLQADSSNSSTHESEHSQLARKLRKPESPVPARIDSLFLSRSSSSRGDDGPRQRASATVNGGDNPPASASAWFASLSEVQAQAIRQGDAGTYEKLVHSLGSQFRQQGLKAKADKVEKVLIAVNGFVHGITTIFQAVEGATIGQLIWGSLQLLLSVSLECPGHVFKRREGEGGSDRHN